MKLSIKKIIISAVLICSICGCSANPPKAAPYDGKDYKEISELTDAANDPEGYLAEHELINNYDANLSVPTYISKYDDTWFIVDCYHNRIIYSDTLGTPLMQWYIMTGEVTQPHTIASDGTVYLVDDTENDRIAIFEKIDGRFVWTQSVNNVGDRPHFTTYDETTDTFYVWSSTTGELYCLRRTPDSSRVYLTDVRSIPELIGIYVRSFSIIDGDIYFVSGVSDEGLPAKIYCCDIETLSIKKAYDVPDSIAGMVQILKIQDYYYISVSTDLSGSQDAATLIRTKSLDELSEGEYEDIYSTYFVGGGSPYYISCVGDTYFLTEHRLKDHSIWSFKVKNNEIVDVESIY